MSIHEHPESNSLENKEEYWSNNLKTYFEAEDKKGEAYCLKELGNIYLMKGKENHDGMDYVKAAALFNAALARFQSCVNGDGQSSKKCPVMHNPIGHFERLKSHIIETEEEYIQQEMNMYSPPKLQKLDELIMYRVCEERKKKIQSFRSNCLIELEDIVKRYPAYEEEHETTEKKAGLEMKRLEAIHLLSKKVSEVMKAITKELFAECLRIAGQPPCEYALMAMGSLATDTITPYSDLELAILLEEGKDSGENKEYFRKAIYLMWIRVINYSETILPTVQIKSLAQPGHEYKSWFEDYVTPRGFSFDGQVPWASKTPLGRKATVVRPAVELIQTPKSMASLHLEQVTQGSVGYNLNYALLNVSLVDGSEKLVNDYRYETEKILDSPLPRNSRLEVLCIQSLQPGIDTVRKVLSFNRLINISKNFKPGNPFEGKTNFDVKKEIYRLPTMIATVFSLKFNIAENNPWEIWEKMKDNGLIQNENAIHLKTVISIATELRLKAYQSYNKQKDRSTGLHQMIKKSENRIDYVFRQDNVPQLARYYATIIPLYENTINLLEEFTSPTCSLPLFREKTLYKNEEKIKAHLNFNFTDYAETIKVVQKQIDLCNENDDKFSGATFFNIFASAYCRLGNYEKAITYHEQDYKMSKQIYGENSAHPDVAYSLNNLASAFHSLGNYEKAITYNEQAHQMFKQIYGENSAHPHITTSLNNLAGTFGSLGNYEKAITYHEQSHQMRKQIYGESTDHPDIASSLNNLASTFYSLGNYEKAITYYEQAHQMFKQINGEYSAHPHIATSLNNLAEAFGSLGNYEKAVTYHKQAHQMRKQIYGENSAHPQIATSLSNLASIFDRLGNYKKAVTYLEQAHQMFKQIYGENSAHPDIASSLNNLAKAFGGLGNYEKAITYHEQAHQMFKQIHGENSAHPNIASSLNNLAEVFGSLGNYEKAITYHEQAHQMRKQIYGENSAHPDIACSLNNLASAFGSLGNYEKALTYHKQAHQMRKQIYGENSAHPDIASSLNNLAEAFGSLGNYEKAITYHVQAHQMFKQIYGENSAHPDIASSLNNLGTTYANLGFYPIALKYLQEALAKVKQMYGSKADHPDIKRLRNNMNVVLEKMFIRSCFGEV